MLFTLCASDTDLCGFHYQASLVLWPLSGFGQRETITGYWEVKGEAYWVTYSLCIFTCAWPELWQWLCSISTALVLQFLFCGPKHFLGFGKHYSHSCPFGCEVVMIRHTCWRSVSVTLSLAHTSFMELFQLQSLCLPFLYCQYNNVPWKEEKIWEELDKDSHWQWDALTTGGENVARKAEQRTQRIWAKTTAGIPDWHYRS